jgi:chromosome segregation ATPase
MHYCPHCHKPTALTSGPCPHCAKELSSEPAAGASVTEHGEISLDEGGAALELDLESGGDGAEPQEGSGEAPGKAPPGPAGKSADRKLRIQMEEESELLDLSGYGRPPEGWLGAVGYLFHVMKQRKVMDARIRQIEEDQKAKKKDMDEDLLVIGRRKMAEPGAEASYALEMGAIAIVTDRVEETRQEKSTEARDMEDKEAFLDDEMLKIENEIGRMRVEEETLGKESQVRSGEYKKARLKMQRFDIEIRNLRQLLANETKAGTTASPARAESFRSQIQDIENQKKAFQPELDTLKGEAEEVDRKLALVRSSISELMGKMTLSKKRKSIVVSSLQQRSQEMEDKYKDVQEEYNDAIRRIARAAFEKKDLPAEFSSMQDKLDSKIKLMDKAQSMLEKHRAARDAWSRVAFQRATIVLGAGAGLFLLLLILLAILL